MKYLPEFVLVVFVVFFTLEWVARKRRVNRIISVRTVPPEGSTSEDQKRLMEQMEIGDPFFDGLRRDWRRNCSPPDREPKRNSNAAGTYCITVGKIATVVIDLRWSGKEIVVKVDNMLARSFSADEVAKAQRILGACQIFDEE